jgi:hypothetical protein
VNFLLHFHLAERDLGSRAAAAGAMLPDLWRMADRRVRPSRVDVASARAPLREVLDGVAHHLAADRAFHAARVFRDGERATAEAFRATKTEAPRLALFAHVAWELCLDGALVLDAGVEAVRAALVDGVDAIAKDGTAAEAATLHHFAVRSRSVGVRAAFDAVMTRMLRELARGPWIEGYASGEGLAARLDRVRISVGFAALMEEERRALATTLTERLAAARDALDEVRRLSA